jgi:hypothetical protein
MAQALARTLKLPKGISLPPPRTAEAILIFHESGSP